MTFRIFPVWFKLLGTGLVCKKWIIRTLHWSLRKEFGKPTCWRRWILVSCAGSHLQRYRALESIDMYLTCIDASFPDSLESRSRWESIWQVWIWVDFGRRRRRRRRRAPCQAVKRHVTFELLLQAQPEKPEKRAIYCHVVTTWKEMQKHAKHHVNVCLGFRSTGFINDIEEHLGTLRN